MLGKIVALFIKHFWQRAFGPKYNKRHRIICRFYPSCSSYAIKAFNKYGFIKGLIKTIDRLSRCNSRNTDSCIDFP